MERVSCDKCVLGALRRLDGKLAQAIVHLWGFNGKCAKMDQWKAQWSDCWCNPEDWLAQVHTSHTAPFFWNPMLLFATTKNTLVKTCFISKSE